MGRVEVLVAAMHQNSLHKYREMNIQTDAVFANQADRYEYKEEIIDGCSVKMITTPQRGVGRNRNTALLYSSAEICLFSDEDVVYADGYERIILDAFAKLADADIIVFNVESLNNNPRNTADIKKIRRVWIFNFIRYGTVRVAMKRESWCKKNIWFSLLFGGGTTYSRGEDSLFLREALKRGLRIYSYPKKIACVKDDTSTWFEGFNEKYFFDHGAWLSAAFPKLKFLGALYYMFRFKKLTSISPFKILKLMLAGMNAFRNGVSYDEWKEKASYRK